MRKTSIRRRVPTARAYRGIESPRSLPTRHDYAGDGPSFVCQDCGARVAVSRPTHAPGGGKSKPWSRCGAQRVASDLEALPALSVSQARAKQLVTRDDIARRFHVSPSAIHYVAKTHGFPEAVARLDGTEQSAALFDARSVEAHVRAVRPRWFKQVPA